MRNKSLRIKYLQIEYHIQLGRLLGADTKRKIMIEGVLIVLEVIQKRMVLQ